MAQPSVLLVEDDPDIRIAIRDQLAWMGIAKVWLAPGAQRATELLAHVQPRLAIIDVEFFPVGGLDLVRKIRHDMPDPARRLPILMMSARGDPAAAQAALDAGANHFIKKPFSAKCLQVALDLVLHDRREFVCEGPYAGPDRRFILAGYDGRNRRGTEAVDPVNEEQDVIPGKSSAHGPSDVLF